MAYTPHVLVAFGGDWTNESGELWECTMRVSADGGGSTVDPDGYLGEIAAPLMTWWTKVGAQSSSFARLAWVKANHIGADGRYVDQSTTHRHDYTPTVGQLGTQGIPQFLTIAYTWETAALRGRAHRGRMYLPNACTQASTAFRISSTNQTAHRTWAKDLLTLLANKSSPNSGRSPDPGIYSKLGGEVQRITGVTVDDTYDVQRRRKNRIKPNRSTVLAFP